MNLFQLVFAVFSLILVIAVAIKVYLRNSINVAKLGKVRLDGKVAIVTGANCGIGLETAKILAGKGVKVILACRDLIAAEKAVEEIKEEYRNAKLITRKLDLGSLTSVRLFCHQILLEETKLDILVNNAGVSVLEKLTSADGFEMHMAVNHLAPFLLTNILLELMKKSERARIVNVSSSLHKWGGRLDLENLNSEKTWTPSTIYAKTKLCNILFSHELNRRLGDAEITNVTTNALHPGGVKTRLFRDVRSVPLYNFFFKLGAIFLKSPWEGAQTSIYLAASKEVEGQTGLYWDNCRVSKESKQAKDRKLAKDLWDISAKLVKLQTSENHLAT